jgi:hypothetical protein
MMLCAGPELGFETLPRTASPASMAERCHIMFVFGVWLVATRTFILIEDRSVDTSPDSRRLLITLAGTPPIKLKEGKSPLTTAPAATIQHFPMVVPPRTMDPAHTQVPSPIWMGSEYPVRRDAAITTCFNLMRPTCEQYPGRHVAVRSNGDRGVSSNKHYFMANKGILANEKLSAKKYLDA